MFDFFEVLGGFVDTILDAVELITRYFELAASAVIYIVTIIEGMPNYISFFLSVMVSLTVILMIINRG